jgi:transcriptional regulator with XRE-family HTH domain
VGEEQRVVEVNGTHDIGIGRRLRAARARLGWNREALAFHSGLSWSAIAQVESGRRRNLRPGTLSALAGALGVTIDYLVVGRVSSPMLEHRALLYDTDAAFVDTVVPFLAAAVERSEPALAVTTKANIELLRGELGPAARRVEFAEDTTWYRAPSDALNGYRKFLDASLETGAPWVRIVGEPVWAAKPKSEIRLWERYESLLNLVFSAEPVTVLCPYNTRAVDSGIAKNACLTHPHVTGCDISDSGPRYTDPSAFVLER